MKTYQRVLTIAGSDSGGGAGIQADIKTISACGCYAASAVTAVTVQNTVGVQAVFPVEVPIITGQIRAVLDDIGTDAIKIGMLHSQEVVRAVAETLRRYEVRNIVLDPVMVAGTHSTRHHSQYTRSRDIVRRQRVDPSRPIARCCRTVSTANGRIRPAESRTSDRR